MIVHALWLRGTMSGKIITWLGVVVDSAHGHGVDGP